MAKKSEFVTKEEAAEILDVTTKTIDRLVSSGKLTKYTRSVGLKRVFFRRTEVLSLLDVKPDEE